MQTCREASQCARAAASRGRAHSFRLALFTALLLLGASSVALADDDLPGRVGRIAEFGGQLYLAPEDRATEWQPIGLNYPVASGDNLWVGGDGRAEVDYGGGQFRLAGDTSLHVSRLDENQLALFVAQGRVVVRVRYLDAGDSARIDAPNSQIQLTRPGLYRIDVAPERQSTAVTVREGEAIVVLAGGSQQTLPGQTAVVTGPDPAYADVRNGVGQDDFDAYSATRDRRYERPRATAYVSPQMVGNTDLDAYGTWQSTPDYGAVWYPSAVAADWAPYRDGYWTNVGAWGFTWVDAAPWGYAPFHYGRWAWVGGRWGWCPGTFVARPRWAPALVGWVGGARWSVSVNAGGPVYGWVPLGWGEPLHPWWGRCSYNCWATYNRPYAVNVATRPVNPPSHFRNAEIPNALTAVSGTTLERRMPVAPNRVAVPTHLMANAPVLASAPAVATGPLRIPGTRAGTAGTPPAASTFYPVTRAGRLAPQPVSRSIEGGVATVPPAQSMARPGSALAPAPTVSPAPYTRPAPAVAPGPTRISPPVANAPVATGMPARGDAQSRARPSAQPEAVPSPSAYMSPAQSAPTYGAPIARPGSARPQVSERVGVLPPAPAAHPMPMPAPPPSAQVQVQHPQAAQAPVQHGQAPQAPALVRPEGRPERAGPPQPKPEPVPGAPSKP